MIILTDTFSDRIISSHRTVRAAVVAQRKHLSAIRRRNGVNSYTTYSFTCTDGRDISEEILNAKLELDCKL